MSVFPLPLRLLLLPLLLLFLPSQCYGTVCTGTGYTEITLRGPHGVIQTPKFPKKFPSPICFKWIIDSTNVSFSSGWGSNQRKSINVYLTQMHLKDGLKFIEYASVPESTGWTTQFVVNRPDLLKTRVFRTQNKYLGIEFNLSTPYQSHLRTRDYFLNEYGFNITYEILPETIPQRNDTCSFSVCSYAGKCLVSHDYKKFYCECFQGHYGTHCQYNYKSCDPNRNISVCVRGSCRNVGSWSAMCYCPDGWHGPRCETPSRSIIKECPGPDCDTLCTTVNQTNRPCSCHNGRMIPKGWVRYEGKLKLADVQLSQWDSRAVSKPSDQRELHILNKIETVLTQQLRLANSSVGNVSIISVGPGSEFVFQFFGDQFAYNVSFSALTNLKSSGQIDESLHLGGSFNFDIQPSLFLKGATVNKRKVLRAGEDFSLTCEAIGSPGLELRWFKDDIPVNTSLSTRYMYEDRVPRNSRGSTVSVLILYQVTIFDRGTFTCQASDMGEEQCATLFVDVLLPPIIEIEPMSLTLVRNESAIVTCFANNDSTNHSCIYTWYKDNEKLDMSGTGLYEVVEDLEYPHGSLLRIIQADVSATYSCVVDNFAGRSSRQVVMHVLDSKHSPSCRRELDVSTNVVWEWTAASQTSMSKCPRNFMGFSQRTCQIVGSKARWGRSDFSHCISNRLITINNTLQKIKMGFAVMNSAESIIELLAYHLENVTLYSGEGENIIHILLDAAKYSEEVHRVKESFPIFFETVTRLLTFYESCVNHRSLITLIKLVQRMATRYSETSSADIPSEFRSEVIIVETIRLDVHLQFDQFSYNFPSSRKSTEYPEWLHLRVQVPLDSFGIQYSDNQFASLLFTVYRNLTQLLSPHPKQFEVKGKSTELVSSIVSIVLPSGYNFNSSSHIHLEFDVSTEILTQSRMNRVNLTCGALDMVPDTIQWRMDACIFIEIVNSTVFCQCDRFGQFALLALHLEDDKEQHPTANFHWSVLAGSIVCIVGCAGALLIISIHIQFRFRINSVYLLKILVCLSLIFSVLVIMIMRNESSSITLSTLLCSLVIVSLCCQLTQSIHVLVSTQLEIFPWLRTVPLLTLLGAVSFAFVLPTWTTVAALSHSVAANSDLKTESVLREGSPVFGVFIATIALIVFIFLVFYYKAILQLRSLRSKEESPKNFIFEYRMKTLNRALIITMATLITILATVLYGNILNGVLFQYFFGLSTFSLGILIFILYTVKSEYPIPHVMMKFLCSASVVPDPENHPMAGGDQGVGINRSHGKLLENGQVSTGLLEGQGQATTSIMEAVGSDATSDTFVGSSITTSILNSSRQGSVKESLSVSNMKRPSISSSRIPRSMTNPLHSSGVNNVHSGVSSMSSSHFHMSSTTGLPNSCSTCCRKNKSHSASISSMRNNSISEREREFEIERCKPERGTCLLSEVTSPDYVMPSISTQVMARSIETASNGGGNPSSGLSSSGLLSGSSSYIDHSPQYPKGNIGERGITQFLTFHQQQQLDRDEEKMYGHRRHQSSHSSNFENGHTKSKLFDSSSTTKPTGMHIDSSSVTVHFEAEKNVSENDGSHPSSPCTKKNPPPPSTLPIISFYKSDNNLPEKKFNPKNESSLNQQPAIPLNELHQHANNGNGNENGHTKRKLVSSDNDSLEDETTISSATCHNLNKSDLLLVKKISHDLSILLDRPKSKGKDYSDVEL